MMKPELILLGLIAAMVLAFFYTIYRRERIRFALKTAPDKTAINQLLDESALLGRLQHWAFAVLLVSVVLLCFVNENIRQSM